MQDNQIQMQMMNFFVESKYGIFLFSNHSENLKDPLFVQELMTAHASNPNNPALTLIVDPFVPEFEALTQCVDPENNPHGKVKLLLADDQTLEMLGNEPYKCVVMNHPCTSVLTLKPHETREFLEITRLNFSTMDLKNFFKEEAERLPQFQWCDEETHQMAGHKSYKACPESAFKK
jgi:hypothetical protein